jgi:hypothetical protein
MEQFFPSTRRYQDRFEAERDDDDGPVGYTEVELAVPVKDFLSCRWDWEDLRAFLAEGATPNILWITHKTFLIIAESVNAFDLDYESLLVCIAAKIQATSGQEQTLLFGHLDDYPVTSVFTRASKVFWRAINSCNIVQLKIIMTNGHLGLPSGPVLSQFLRESSSLRVLKFVGFNFEEEHCRALVTLERTDLDLKLHQCLIEPRGAEDTFVEWFRHNEVLTEINCCHMGSRILSALSGNNSVKKVVISRQTRHVGNTELHALALSLSGNMGIEQISLNCFDICDEIWSLLFRSLSAHPRVNSLSIRNPFLYQFSAEAKTKRMKPILQMLYSNPVVHTINLPSACTDFEVYQRSILPRLEMNRTCFNVQRQALKRADPSIRPQLLGRALHVVRYNPELVYLFLSENVPAFARTEEEVEVEDSGTPLLHDPSIVSRQKRKAPS